MGLVGRFSYKLLVGGIFAVLIFSLVGSQQVMANGPTTFDIEIDKCASTVESDIDSLSRPGCVNIGEGSAASSFIIEANEGDTVFFRIDAAVDLRNPGVTGVVVTDFLPNGLIFVSSKDLFSATGGYFPASGTWDVGRIFEGGSRSILITTIVGTGTCGTTLVNTATLTAVNEEESPSSNNQDSVSVKVVPKTGEDCPPIVRSPGDVFVVMGTFGNNVIDDGSLATANLDTGELTQIGPAIIDVVEGSGLSGLAIDSSGRFFVTVVEC